MGHPRKRTWTLATLDRDQAYRLWFDHAANRWEVRSVDQTSGTLTTRPPRQSDAGPSPQRSEAGVRPAGAATGA